MITLYIFETEKHTYNNTIHYIEPFLAKAALKYFSVKQQITARISENI
jgi:hypothetical protein